MQNMFLVLHLLICVVLVGAVLMQRSEGGALGMGGGGGGLISGRGAADMMVNITSWVGGAFFVTSIVLTVMAGARPVDRSVITDGQKPQSGIHFNLPFFNQNTEKKTAPTPLTSAPSPALPAPQAPSVPIGAAVAPTPVEAVTRAGPLDPVPPPDTAAPRSTPAASLPPSSGQRVAGPIVAGPVGAPAQKTGAPVGSSAPKAQRPAASPQRATPAPMIPLPVQSLPVTAQETESPQPAIPAPTPRDRTGPDE
jgi:preprotein translocase subunit SecG